MMISLYALESGWEPHWQGASIFKAKLPQYLLEIYCFIGTNNYLTFLFVSQNTTEGQGEI